MRKAGFGMIIKSGDPIKSGEAIYKAVNAKEKPEVLILGKGMIEAAEKTLDDRKAEIERWRQISESTDFISHSFHFSCHSLQKYFQ